VKEIKKKILVFAVALMAVVLLSTPLVAGVNAKPAVATVEFYSETWPRFGDLGEKMRMAYARKSNNLMIHRLSIFGSGNLIDPEEMGDVNFPLDFVLGKGGVRLTIDDGVEEYVLTGSVDQVLLRGMITAGGGHVVHKTIWTILFAGEGAPPLAVGSTLEVLGVSRPGGGLKAVGTRGTGIFEGAQFRGTYTSEIYNFGQVLFRMDTGSGEIKFT
jgi:hypothetical protein